MTILVLYRFIILSTSYLIPQYLTTVQNFRSLEVGKVLAWIAVPQFLLVPLIATVLRWIDPRLILALGLWCVGLACFMASDLTRDWATDDFLASQVLQAFGQSAALISLVLFAVRHLRPADAVTFGVVLQTARLLGGEAGNAFMQTYVRVREQVDSNLLGLHVMSGDVDTARPSGRLRQRDRRPLRRRGGGVRTCRVAAGAGGPQPGECAVVSRRLHRRGVRGDRDAAADRAAAACAESGLSVTRPPPRSFFRSACGRAP